MTGVLASHYQRYTPAFATSQRLFMLMLRPLLMLLGLAIGSLTLALSLTLPAHAEQGPLRLQQLGVQALSSQLQWLEDPAKQLSPLSALASPNWQAHDSDSLNFGFSASVFWLHTRLANDTAQAQWALWIRYSLLDSVELWLCPAHSQALEHCHYQQAGDLQPFQQGRSVSHPNTIFTLPLAPQQSYQLLLRVDTQGTFQLPLTLLDEASLQQQLAQQNILRGAYCGILLVMGLYNLFIFFSTRSRSYLYYASFTLSFLLLHMVYEGSAFQFLWPNFPELNRYALPIAYAINMLLLTLFVPSFLNLREQNSNAYRLFRGYSALILVSLPMLPIVQYQWLVPFYVGLNMLLTLSALATGVYFWLQGNRSARFFSIAWLAFIIGLMLANARSLGLIPSNNITLFAYQIGSFIEIVLLSMALADRIIQLQKEQRNMRQSLQQSQAQALSYLHDYEDLYQNSLIGKFELDQEGYFLKSNAAWRELIGYHDQQHFTNDNPSFDSLIHDNKQRRRFWQALKERGQVQSYILHLTQPTTHERIVASITMRLDKDRGGIWLASGQDVSENYAKEQALVHLQQEKAQSLHRLVLGISAEMQTPLDKLRDAENYLNLEEHALAGEEQQALTQGLTLIKQGSLQLSELERLIRNAIIDPEDYPKANIHIRDWLTHWRQTQLERHPQLRLHTAVHSYFVEWCTSATALQWILDQLLEHSCRLNSELYEQAELKIGLTLKEHGETWELHFQDNGPHLSSAERELTFMPFSTAQADVTHKGLGLYQAYNLISEVLHGTIEWPDEADGFHVLIRLPLPTPNAETTES